MPSTAQTSSATATLYAAGQPALNHQRTEIAFVLDNVVDWQTLAAGVRAGVEVVVLDSTGDGLAQMADWLAHYALGSVDAIHLLGHGNSGAVNLGALTLSSDNLGEHADTLAQIGAALTDDGDWLVYGCNVAARAAGVDLVVRLAQASGADMAASDDLTGSAALGGDWVLESAANVETVFLASRYAGLLATPSNSTTFETYEDYIEFTSSSPTTSGFTASNVLGWDITTKTTNNGDTETWLNAAESQFGYSGLQTGDANPNSITSVIFKSNDTSLTLFDLQSLKVHYDRINFGQITLTVTGYLNGSQVGSPVVTSA